MNTWPLHLSKIDLLAFRGVERTLELEFGRRLTIVYGGNATGKSSIAQAIEFALSGQVRDYEDGLIPAGYLANTRARSPGRVALTLDDGSVLTGATDRPRSDIERRFRDVGAVDWPDRQPLPITTTHVTAQGMLSRVLGSANAVTRNDLSGLCAGAYLRFLVSRAQKLADHFRQASSGRNIQAELRDARGAYDTAKLLHDSLLATSQTADVSSTGIDLRLRELTGTLHLPDATSVDAALSHMDAAIEMVERDLRILQGLLARTRELGQHEAELAQLKKQMDDGTTIERSLQERKAAATAAFRTTAERLSESADQRTRLIDLMAAYERYQQSSSAIAALDERLREVRSNEQRAKEDIRVLRDDLDGSRRDLRTHATELAQLRQSRQVADVQRNVIERALVGLAALPASPDPGLEGALDVLRRELADLEQVHEATARELEDAREKEEALAARLAEVSESGERFLAASSELRAFLRNGHCPLCGHDHGSPETLEESIEHVSATMLQGADLLRVQFAVASKARQDFETRQVHIVGRVASTRARLSGLILTVERRAEDRRNAIVELEQSLRHAALTLSLETEVLQRGQADSEGRIAGLDQNIRDRSTAEREDEARQSQLERAVAAKSSDAEQLQRLAVELEGHLEKVRATLVAGTAAQDITRHKADLAELEPLVRTLEREQGQTQAGILELDRALAEKGAEIAGIQLRLQVVEAFLDSVDRELTGVGASRDIRTVLDMEQRVRQQRDDMVLLKGKALEIKQEQRILDESRALSRAREQLRAAEKSLKSAQNRQQRLQERSVQFKTLHEGLGNLQNATAEIVLDSIRKPVSIVFQAMTAGCPWDIEFRLEDGRVNAVLTDGSARDVAATSVLNSAYVNVAAIALRLALASQQRWTRLRTVVLDDPILEMDHLTQSAVIDGLEAVLASAFSPWADLQFVVTTWSEDFAVMAAHKLAHLNHNSGQEAATSTGTVRDDFVIHRLSSDREGIVVSQRHVPRWRKEASAA